VRGDVRALSSMSSLAKKKNDMEKEKKFRRRFVSKVVVKHQREHLEFLFLYLYEYGNLEFLWTMAVIPKRRTMFHHYTHLSMHV